MGGNAFTKAIADTFRLNFDSGEAQAYRANEQIREADIAGDEASVHGFGVGDSAFARFYTSSHSNVKLQGLSRWGVARRCVACCSIFSRACKCR